MRYEKNVRITRLSLAHWSSTASFAARNLRACSTSHSPHVCTPRTGSHVQYPITSAVEHSPRSLLPCFATTATVHCTFLTYRGARRAFELEQPLRACRCAMRSAPTAVRGAVRPTRQVRTLRTERDPLRSYLHDASLCRPRVKI